MAVSTDRNVRRTGVAEAAKLQMFWVTLWQCSVEERVAWLFRRTGMSVVRVRGNQTAGNGLTVTIDPMESTNCDLCLTVACGSSSGEALAAPLSV